MKVLCENDDFKGGATVHLNQNELKILGQSFGKEELSYLSDVLLVRLKSLNNIKELFVTASVLDSINSEIESCVRLNKKVVAYLSDLLVRD